MTAGEFEVIERYFTRRSDDCTVVAAPQGGALVLAVDTIVEGVHFPAGFDARFVGHRALAINLSDLAAMGAEPAWALLALTLPAVDEHWLSGFAAGLDTLARRHGVALVGGDTTRGPLTVSLTLAGTVPDGQAMLRSGARAGDDLWISGTPGDAAAGLAILRDQLPAQGRAREALLARFQLPQARVTLGVALRGVASACIDVSDGLAGDAAKLCTASKVGVEIDSRELPLSAGLCSVASRDARLAYALGGGDDYELLFTADPAHRARLAALDAGVVLKRIGVVVEAEGVRSRFRPLHSGAACPPVKRDPVHGSAGFDEISSRGIR